MTEELLESYLNGNISYVREQMKREGIYLCDMIELYVEMYDPDGNEIVLMIRRLGQ